MNDYLYKSGIISDDIILFHQGVRDDNSINVMKCQETGLLFLDKIIEQNYSQKGLGYWNSSCVEESRKKNIRR